MCWGDVSGNKDDYQVSECLIEEGGKNHIWYYYDLIIYPFILSMISPILAFGTKDIDIDLPSGLLCLKRWGREGELSSTGIKAGLRL